MSLEGIGAIADPGKALENVAQRELGRIPLDAGAMGGGIDVDVTQTAQGHQVPLDEPGTGGAGQTFHRQLDLARSFATRTGVGDELLLHLRQIVVGEGGELFGHQFPLDAGSGAVFVITGEAAFENGLCHGLTARATHRLNDAFDLESKVTASGNRFTTVKTAGHGDHPSLMQPSRPGRGEGWLTGVPITLPS